MCSYAGLENMRDKHAETCENDCGMRVQECRLVGGSVHASTHVRRMRTCG